MTDQKADYKPADPLPCDLCERSASSLHMLPDGTKPLKVVLACDRHDPGGEWWLLTEKADLEGLRDNAAVLDRLRPGITGRLPAVTASSGVGVASLHRRAQRALQENLADDEEVRVIITGAGGKSALIGTDRRAFIFKIGMLVGATFGQKLSSFDYRNIAGVQLHFGMATGSVVLDVAGAAPVGSSYWGKTNNDPWQAQNAIPVVRPVDPVKAGVATLRQLIAEWHSAQRADSPAAVDLVAQIEALGSLRDRGLLTNEEFDAKKAEILKRI